MGLEELEEIMHVSSSKESLEERLRDFLIFTKDSTYDPRDEILQYLEDWELAFKKEELKDNIVIGDEIIKHSLRTYFYTYDPKDSPEQYTIIVNQLQNIIPDFLIERYFPEFVGETTDSKLFLKSFLDILNAICEELRKTNKKIKPCIEYSLRWFYIYFKTQGYDKELIKGDYTSQFEILYKKVLKNSNENVKKNHYGKLFLNNNFYSNLPKDISSEIKKIIDEEVESKEFYKKIVKLLEKAGFVKDPFFVFKFEYKHDPEYYFRRIIQNGNKYYILIEKESGDVKEIFDDSYSVSELSNGVF